MPPNSVAVFFANPIRNRANDGFYSYHQDPNFYYLTGYREPHAAILIFKENQDINGVSVNELFFARERNALKEMYDGARLGKEGVMKELMIQLSYEGKEFKDFEIDFSKFDKVMFYDFFDDVRDFPENGDLFEIIEQFKKKVGYGEDPLTLNVEPTRNNIDLETLDLFMHKLRGIKTEEELVLLRKAVNISTAAQAEVMKAMEPGLSEMHIQGIHEFVHKIYTAEDHGYQSIIGAGHNGCVLHYRDSYKPAIEDGELILMDVGAEYRGYTADVTRTIPVNGKFTKEQKIIYDLVYKAQQAGWDICKEGTTFEELTAATNKVINEGLVELGLYESTRKEDMLNPATGRNWYNPHGCCHHIGLDVHDPGNYNTFEENMVVTMEPGIYIPEGSNCDKKWWGIAIRIEDDILVTKNGPINLSAEAPRTTPSSRSW